MSKKLGLTMQVHAHSMHMSNLRLQASQSEPHINQLYEKITVLMYVCMYVAIRCPHVHHACACVHMFVTRTRGKY